MRQQEELETRQATFLSAWLVEKISQQKPFRGAWRAGTVHLPTSTHLPSCQRSDGYALNFAIDQRRVNLRCPFSKFLSEQ